MVVVKPIPHRHYSGWLLLRVPVEILAFKHAALDVRRSLWPSLRRTFQFPRSSSAGCHTAAALRHLDSHSALDSVVVMIINLVSLCLSIPSPLTSATLERLIFATSGSYRNEPVTSLDSGLSPVLVGSTDNDQGQDLPHWHQQ